MTNARESQVRTFDLDIASVVIIVLLHDHVLFNHSGDCRDYHWLVDRDRLCISRCVLVLLFHLFRHFATFACFVDFEFFRIA